MKKYEDDSMNILQNINNNKEQITNFENQYTKQNKEID